MHLYRKIDRIQEREDMRILNRRIHIAMAFTLLISSSLTACSEQIEQKPHIGIPAEYETALFTDGTLNEIEIRMDDWDAFIEKEATKEHNWIEEILSPPEKEYDACDIRINGDEIQNVGIRTKGIYSLQTAVTTGTNKFSLVLKFNQFTDKQKYHGLRMLDLNSCLLDATSMKDAVTYDMFRFIGLPAPLCNYAKISVNGEYFGCYLAVEPVGKDFCKRNYGEDYGSLYKPMHDLCYSRHSDEYEYLEKMVKIQRSPFSRVKNALKSVHQQKDIEEHVNVDAVLKYMAVQTMVVNLDGLTGEIMHNYYLYESDGRISLIPWDYDMAFGGMLSSDEKMDLQKKEAQENGTFNEDAWRIEKEAANIAEVRQIINLPIDTPFIGELSEREFFLNLLENEAYKAQYHAYLSELAETYVKGGKLDEAIDRFTAEIGEIVGTGEHTYYKSGDFSPAVAQLRLFLQRKAESVICQLNGTIPTTRDEQANAPETLVDTSDINVRLMGDLWKASTE